MVLTSMIPLLKVLINPLNNTAISLTEVSLCKAHKHKLASTKQRLHHRCCALLQLLPSCSWLSNICSGWWPTSSSRYQLFIRERRHQNIFRESCRELHGR